MPTTTFFNLPPPKREKLFQAAIAEFARRPYGEVSINRIIQAAEIPRGSFYQYFSDKTDLFRYVLRHYGEWISVMVTESLDACGGQLLELPLTIFDRMLEKYRANEASFHDLFGIARQNIGMDASRFLDFQAARHTLLERVDPSGLADLSPEGVESLFKLLILLTAHALMSACCGKDSVEELRGQLARAVEIIRRGAINKEEPLC